MSIDIPDGLDLENKNNFILKELIDNNRLEDIGTLLENQELDVDTAVFVLKYSCIVGNIDVLKLVLETNTIEANVLNNIAIRLACKYGQTEIVELLLSIENVDPTTNGGNTTIKVASQNGFFDIVNLLLYDGRVDPSSGPKTITPLELATKNNHLNIVKLLLSNARVDPTRYDNNAFIFAILRGNIDMINAYLSSSKINPAHKNNVAFRLACQIGNVDVVKVLLQDPRINPADSNNDAIIQASIKGNVDVLKLLLQEEKVNPADQENKALLYACHHGHAEAVRILLEDERINPTNGVLPLTVETIKHAITEVDTSRFFSNSDVKVVNVDLRDKKELYQQYIDIVRMLLQDERVNATEEKHLAIRTAVTEQLFEIVMLLVRWYKKHKKALPSTVSMYYKVLVYPIEELETKKNKIDRIQHKYTWSEYIAIYNLNRNMDINRLNNIFGIDFSKLLAEPLAMDVINLIQSYM